MTEWEKGFEAALVTVGRLLSVSETGSTYDAVFAGKQMDEIRMRINNLTRRRMVIDLVDRKKPSKRRG